MQALKINTAKIDKSALYEGKQGKYLNIVTIDNKEGPDQYGNDGFIVQELPQSRREAGEKGPIIGNWKHIVKKSQAAPKQPADPLSKEGLAQTSLNPDSQDEYPF